MKKIVGRDFKQCDYTIYDPEKRVSRIHLVVEKNDKGYILYDEASSNGTFVNGNKIPHKKYVQIKNEDNVTLSISYLLNLNEVFDDDRTSILLHSNNQKSDDDSTRILVVENQNKSDDVNDILVKSQAIDDATKIISNQEKQEDISDKTVIINSKPESLKEPEFITIGRSRGNKIVLQNNLKISGEHCKIRCINNTTIEIVDNRSTNGTFVNNQKLEHKKVYRFSTSVKVNLANELTLDLKKIFPNINPISPNNSQVKLDINGKKVVLDSDKTTIGEVLEFETLPFITIGRKTGNKIVIDQTKVSGFHCKVRLLNPMMFEIIDLGSTNGTYANKEKLIANKSYIYPSSTTISLGIEFPLNLSKILKGMIIVESPKPIQSPINPNSFKPITQEEIRLFESLEEIWEEYLSRQHQIGSVANNWSMGGLAIGAIASIFTGGIGGAVIAAGSGLLGRYLGNQKSQEIKTDMNYENMFLVTYSCPRCKESFQKRPWITIRECVKCKIKFRE